MGLSVGCCLAVRLQDDELGACGPQTAPPSPLSALFKCWPAGRLEEKSSLSSASRGPPRSQLVAHLRQRGAGKGKLQAVALTKDHRPGEQTEKGAPRHPFASAQASKSTAMCAASRHGHILEPACIWLAALHSMSLTAHNLSFSWKQHLLVCACQAHPAGVHRSTAPGGWGTGAPQAPAQWAGHRGAAHVAAAAGHPRAPAQQVQPPGPTRLAPQHHAHPCTLLASRCAEAAAQGVCSVQCIHGL